MPNQLSIGLDIGATKMVFVVADETGSIHARKILPTHREHPAADTLDRVAAVLNEYLQLFAEVCGIGIGVPGPVDSRNGIAINAVNLNWQQVEVRKEIAARLTGSLPLYLDNDVNAGAIGEQFFGAAIGVDNYVYLTAGTGFGGAAIINGRLLRGATHSEMEIGHVSIDPENGRQCNCGLRGCLETSISGSGIVAIAEQLIGGFPQSKLDASDLSTHSIIHWAEKNDSLARAVMDEAAVALGIACAWCVNLFNPEMIVLGGGLMHGAYHLLEAAARRAIEQRCLNQNLQATAITLSRHSDAALGASALVWHSDEGTPDQ